MDIQAAGFSECGERRRVNEDSIYLNSRLGLFVVADGMGGLARGDYASRNAIERFVAAFRSSEIENFETVAIRALKIANQFLHEQSVHQKIKCGTTFTAAHISKLQHLHFLHVGDTALWRIRRDSGQIELLTTPHTVETEYLSRGRDRSTASQYRNVLTRALGLSILVNPQIGELRIEPTDLFVLCSDGFVDAVSPSDLVELSFQYHDVSVLVEQSRQLAFTRDPRDNYSAIFFELGPRS